MRQAAWAEKAKWSRWDTAILYQRPISGRITLGLALKALVRPRFALCTEISHQLDLAGKLN